MKYPYSMLIRWSEEDQIFLIFFPELTGSDRACTHGDTYEEAARKGQEVLELLIESYQEWGWPLPEPSLIKV